MLSIGAASSADAPGGVRLSHPRRCPPIAFVGVHCVGIPDVASDHGGPLSGGPAPFAPPPARPQKDTANPQIGACWERQVFRLQKGGIAPRFVLWEVCVCVCQNGISLCFPRISPHFVCLFVASRSVLLLYLFIYGAWPTPGPAAVAGAKNSTEVPRVSAMTAGELRWGRGGHASHPRCSLAHPLGLTWGVFGGFTQRGLRVVYVRLRCPRAMAASEERKMGLRFTFTTRRWRPEKPLGQNHGWLPGGALRNRQNWALPNLAQHTCADLCRGI